MVPDTWPSLVPGGLILAAAAGCRERLAWVAWGSRVGLSCVKRPILPFANRLLEIFLHPLPHFFIILSLTYSTWFSLFQDWFLLKSLITCGSLSACTHFQPDVTDFSVESNSGETSLCPAPGTPHTCWPRGRRGGALLPDASSTETLLSFFFSTCGISGLWL